MRFFNNIEAGLSCQGQWQSIKDFPSKSAKNAARLSALFHLYEGYDGDISTEHHMIRIESRENKALIEVNPVLFN